MTVRTKLLSIFLLFVVLPTALFLGFFFSQARAVMKEKNIQSLISVGELKKERIETYFATCRHELEGTRNIRLLRNTLPLLTKPLQPQAARSYQLAIRELDEHLSLFLKTIGYKDVMLTDREGRVVYTVDKSQWARHVGKPLQDPGGQAFSRGRQGVYLSDIFRDPLGENALRMLGAAPVQDLQGNFTGLIVFEFDLEFIYGFIQDTTGLGVTGETLLGKRVGDAALFLNPLRHDPQAALLRTVRMSNVKGLPMQNAVRGKKGAGIGRDYRGKEVIAAWDFMPALGWGLVAKIDTSEAFAEVNHLERLVVIMGIVLLLSALLAIFLLSRVITGPLQALQIGTEVIGSGNLEYRVGTTAGDEIGQLSRSVDRMAENLKKVLASRDDLEREVADRKKAEESLSRAIADLNRSNAELEQFSAVVSHDLQEPLRTVESYVHLLTRRYVGQFDADADKFSGFIVDSVNRMQLMINDLLQLSRVGTRGKEFQPVDCNLLLANVLGQLHRAIEESGAMVTSEPLPTVNGDETQLAMLFQNLIGNALKFRGEAPPRIHVGAVRKGNLWCFSVNDNGIGIDPAYFARVFLIFQRLHPRSRYEGTGIGLALGKKVVERHGGTIWVESQPGVGTTFFFTLPTATAEG